MSNRPVWFPADNSARIPADIQPQDGPAGTRYLSPGSLSFDVSCGPACGAVTLTFQTQYSQRSTGGFRLRITAPNEGLLLREGNETDQVRVLREN